MKKYEKPWFIALAIDQNDVVTASYTEYDNDADDKDWKIDFFQDIGNI